MFLNIRELELGALPFDKKLGPGAIGVFDGKIRQAGLLEAKGVAELLTATEEIRIRGHMRVAMETECDRCLEAVSWPIDADFDLLYRPEETAPAEEDLEIWDEDMGVGYYEGSGLDLNEAFREFILLSIPMQQVCREDCRGICPACGQNRNQMDCGCHPQMGDDRWSALKNL